MKVFWLISLFFSIALATMSFSFFKRDYCDIAQDIRSKVGKKLSKKHKMDLIIVGGGMIDCVRMVNLGFQINHPLSLDEARCLIIDCAEELLKAFNENKEIRPHLQNYPFTPQNITMKVFMTTQTNGDLFYPNIYVVSILQEDKIYYKFQDENHKQLPPIVESYQEALAKVRNGGCPPPTQPPSQPT